MEKKDKLQRAQSAMDSASLEIYFTNKKGQLLYINTYASLAWGIEEDQLEQYTIFDINPELTREEWNRECAILEKEGSCRYTGTHTSKAGYYYPVNITRNTIHFKKEILICSFARDITQEKMNHSEIIEARDQARASDRLKSEFLANLSHEIRTPMNAIIGFSYLLKSGLHTEQYTKEKLSHFTDLILENGNHLLELIDDIIDFSKIEANQLKLSESDCNIPKLLEEIYTSFSLSLPEEIHLEHHFILSEKYHIIQADKTRLKQILINLLSNAKKHTPNGTIDFGCRKVKEELWFFVKDTGSGIPEEKQKEIFQRFHQLDYLTPGAGLGLNICMGLIHLMKGRLWLKSEEKSGTTFYFAIPLKIHKQ